MSSEECLDFFSKKDVLLPCAEDNMALIQKSQQDNDPKHALSNVLNSGLQKAIFELWTGKLNRRLLIR